MKNNHKIVCILLVSMCCSLLFISCQDKNPYHRDVDDIEVEVDFIPFHADIQSVAENPTPEALQGLHEKYGLFFQSFVNDIHRNFCSQFSQEREDSTLSTFIHDAWVDELYRESDSAFLVNKKMYIEKTTNALQYYKYYFPERTIPQLFTCVSGAMYSMVLDSNVIAIGIDKYIGKNAPIYSSMQVESYIQRNMSPEKLPSDLMRALAESEFPTMFDEDYLLAQMIQCGRYQYFVKCMLPDESDTLLWGYTKEQLDFCEASEGEFWKYFIGTGNLLFSNDYMMHKRFLEDGPFTSVFSKDSPARIGQWIGFKIVEFYMKNNPQTTLEQLFQITSSKEIMSKSKYNPK